MRQLVYALRALRKSPGFTVSALVILTLGIGANTAIFGIVDAVLLKPLPFPQPASVVTVFHVPPAKSFPGMKIFAVSAANYVDWKKDNTVFESMAVIGFGLRRLTESARPISIRATLTGPDFFRVLRVQPALGRVFTAAECRPGRDDVVILRDSFARAQFGSPQNALGRTLPLSGRNYRIIGVMAPEFELNSWFPTSTEVWLPLAWTPKDAAVRGNHNYLVVARLRPGVTVAQAQAQMNLISDHLAREYPEEDTGWGAAVSSLSDFLVGNVRPALLILLGAVGFVLLIACANTANLVLARTITRRKDLAIRAALGASAAQMLRPILIETTVLSLAGGLCGLLLAQYGQLLVLKALADKLPRAVDIHLDGRVLAFTFTAAILTGLAAGLIAAWRLTRSDVQESLKQGLGKTSAFSGRARTRNALVAIEVALSLMLLVGAGLMVRTLWALKHTNPGFVSSNVLTMTVPIPSSAQSGRFYHEFLPAVRHLPGVVSAGAIDTLPLDNGGSEQPIVIEGRPHEVFALQPNVAVRETAPGYIRTMQIPLLAGRLLEPRDTTSGHAVVLISQTMARQFWPGQNPLGQHLRISFTPDILREVVGVVADVKERGLDVLAPVAMLYEPLLQGEPANISLAVRATRPDPDLAPEIAHLLRTINPESPVRDVRWMDQIVAESLAQHRFSMYLFAALAALAFLLAAVGIYSVLAYSVRSRVQEIGIRIALGASLSTVLRLVVFEGMRPALAGVVAGAIGAVLLSSILSRLVFGVSATDPYTFGAVAALLTAVALLACLIPAYRAARIEPVRALRHE